MQSARFTLRIQIPDEIEPEVATRIVAEMVEHDDMDNALLRWLGSYTSDAENTLNSQLPEGWYCKIEGGVVLP